MKYAAYIGFAGIVAMEKKYDGNMLFMSSIQFDYTLQFNEYGTF